jgi:predicted transcriptional regulator
VSARSDRVKATMELPRDLWDRVQHRAIDEKRPAWRIVADALEAYLSRKTGAAKKEKIGGAR